LNFAQLSAIKTRWVIKESMIKKSWKIEKLVAVYLLCRMLFERNWRRSGWKKAFFATLHPKWAMYIFLWYVDMWIRIECTKNWFPNIKFIAQLEDKICDPQQRWIKIFDYKNFYFRSYLGKTSSLNCLSPIIILACWFSPYLLNHIFVPKRPIVC
jgi:hypothetical protein